VFDTRKITASEKENTLLYKPLPSFGTPSFIRNTPLCSKQNPLFEMSSVRTSLH
jgi:hypothetical protein